MESGDYPVFQILGLSQFPHTALELLCWESRSNICHCSEPCFDQRSHVKILCCCASDFYVHSLLSGEPPVARSLWMWCPISQLFSLNYQRTTCQTLTIKMSKTKISCPQKEGRNLLTNCITAERYRLKSMQRWPWYQRHNTGYREFFNLLRILGKITKLTNTDCLEMVQP